MSSFTTRWGNSDADAAIIHRRPPVLPTFLYAASHLEPYKIDSLAYGIAWFAGYRLLRAMVQERPDVLPVVGELEVEFGRAIRSAVANPRWTNSAPAPAPPFANLVLGSWNLPGTSGRGRCHCTDCHFAGTADSSYQGD